ncbi:hypothetical protein CPB86DRAFT_872123 [Serendipita vermifera]|nr:hypothetical protein CPB86DRAFT_872123 [Serendipita vermifera]
MAQDLLTLFSAHTKGKFIQVSFHTWVIYDNIITVDKTFELFWKQPWNLSKALFFTNRYVSALTVSLYTLQQFVKDPSTTVCYTAFWVGYTGSLILISILNLAMLLRVNALWNHSRVIKGITTFLSLVNILGLAVSGTYSWATADVKPHTPPFTGCSAVPRVSLKLNVVLIPSVLFETYALVLTLIKVYPMIEHRKPGLPIVALLLSDSIAYYIVIIFAQVLTVALSFFKNVGVTLPIVVISVVTCNRLFIRLQGVLVESEIIVFDVTTGAGVAGRAWIESSSATSRDVHLPPTDYGQRGRQGRRPMLTQCSDI